MRLKQFMHDTPSKEPIGIVIADGGYGDSLPRFSAFVWGPVPEDLDVVEPPKQLATAAA
jgi:hypothetical protein